MVSCEVVSIFAGVNGYLDKLKLDDIKEFEGKYLEDDPLVVTVEFSNLNVSTESISYLSRIIPEQLLNLSKVDVLAPRIEMYFPLSNSIYFQKESF